MKNNIKKLLVITVIVCVSLLVGILGSYAFFISTGGNNKPEELSVQTGNMVLVFEDGNAGINEALNFGSSITKTFTIENTGSLDATARMSFDKLTNSYTYGSLTFTLEYSESENGTYQEILSNRNIFTSKEPTTQVLANNLSVLAGEKYYYKLTITLNYLDDIDQTEDLNAMLSTNFTLSEGSQNVIEKIKASSHPASEQPNFQVAATTDEGIYQMEDDYGTSYYFRGAIENNYVKFANFWWRIIRVNGDGTLRIIYDGTEAHPNGEANEDRAAIRNVAFNTICNDAKYEGYMYGPAGAITSTSREEAQSNIESSTIKLAVDNWYKTNILENGYHSYISDNLFCNDRSIPGKNITGHSKDTGLGYGNNMTLYGTYLRNGKNNNNITFKCPQQNDSFTMINKEKGNAALTYPIALISIDEMRAAGSGSYSTSITNKQYYLYNGQFNWSSSPDSFNNSCAGMFGIDVNGNFGSRYVNLENTVSPVINLSLETVESLIGTGTMTNPYRLESEAL